MKGWSENFCCTSSVLLCPDFPSSSKEPLRRGSAEAKRALHARTESLAWCNDNSQPPVTPMGDKSLTCVVGRIFPGEMRNLVLDTKVFHY